MALDRPAVERMLAEHVDGRADLSRGLWTLLSLALWHDRHYRPRQAAETATSVALHLVS